MLRKCRLCPRNCDVNREEGQRGFCNIGNKIAVSKIMTHMWEEPCISGTKGSAAVFFTGCNLRCVYCQNHDISRRECIGKEISSEELADIFIQKQKEGTHNINLVSPTPYIPMIKESIILAKGMGLVIPIVYNSNGYESAEALKYLDGLVDVYLPDFKYGIESEGEKYSNVKEYSKNAVLAIKEMYRQVGNPSIDKDGIIQKGLVIRHLVIPGIVENSKKVLDIIKENIGKDVYISIMGQYIPEDLVKIDREYAKINRKITEDEYDEVIDYFFDIGLENGFMQELDSANEKYIPKW